MESIDLDMDDLFDVRGDVDEDAAFPPSPTGFGDNEAPENGGGVTGEGEENEEGEIQSQVIQKLRDMSKGAGKRVIRNPQPKLDADRLNGDRGIPVLPKLFKEFKLKGPGHEIDDLNAMMRKMEHWAHRLYPKMTFDEVIERVERLGGKKAVQTTIKKIRLDIPLLDEDFADREDEEKNSGDEADDRKDEPGDRLGFPDEVDLIDSDAENVLDEMLREDSTLTQPINPALNDKPLSSQLSTPRDGEPSTPILSQTPQSNSTIGTAASPVLTDEVKERIERNKRLALERRQARLKGLTPAKTGTASTPVTPSSQAFQVEASQPFQNLKDSQSPTKTPKGTEKNIGQKSNGFPSEDDMHLFVDATMETEDHSGAKSKENSSEEKLHLFVEETMDTKKEMKDKDAKSNDSVETDTCMHLFVEPTMETEKRDVQPKSSSESLHLFVEPTIETDTHGSLKEMESDPIESAMDDDLDLFIDETAATEQEAQMKETKSKEGVSEGTLNIFVDETVPMGELSDLKRNTGKKDENEMTEGELHLFLEETESVGCNTVTGGSGSSGEKSDSADGTQKMTDQDNDADELHLCIDSTEESQEEEEMDTGGL